MPDIVQVTSFQPKHQLGDPEDSHGGKILGTVTVNIMSPSRPQPIDARLLIYEEGTSEPVLTIPVSGQLLPRIQVVPSTLVFPRFTGDGPVYSASFVCRSTEDKPFRLRAAEVDGLKIRVRPPEDVRTTQLVIVEWAEDHVPITGEAATRTVTLTAQLDDGEEVLTVPISCRRAEDLQ